MRNIRKSLNEARYEIWIWSWVSELKHEARSVWELAGAYERMIYDITAFMGFVGIPN